MALFWGEIPSATVIWPTRSVRLDVQLQISSACTSGMPRRAPVLVTTIHWRCNLVPALSSLTMDYSRPRSSSCSCSVEGESMVVGLLITPTIFRSPTLYCTLRSLTLPRIPFLRVQNAYLFFLRFHNLRRCPCFGHGSNSGHWKCSPDNIED